MRSKRSFARKKRSGFVNTILLSVILFTIMFSFYYLLSNRAKEAPVKDSKSDIKMSSEGQADSKNNATHNDNEPDKKLPLNDGSNNNPSEKTNLKGKDSLSILPSSNQTNQTPSIIIQNEDAFTPVVLTSDPEEVKTQLSSELNTNDSNDSSNNSKENEENKSTLNEFQENINTEEQESSTDDIQSNISNGVSDISENEKNDNNGNSENNLSVNEVIILDSEDEELDEAETNSIAESDGEYVKVHPDDGNGTEDEYDFIES